MTLQHKRQRLLRYTMLLSLLTIHLPRVEQQIQPFQEETTKTVILKIEQTYREHRGVRHWLSQGIYIRQAGSTLYFYAFGS